MSTHNIGFYEDLTKIIFELSSISSITHLISSAGFLMSYAATCFKANNMKQLSAIQK